MLRLIVPGDEYFNEETQEFEEYNGFELEMEHSLVSVSKWESKFLKPFLGEGAKTPEEVLAYVELMILSENYPEDWAERLTQGNFDEINEYINSRACATTFGEMPETRRGRGETITAELIYFWMVSYNIPFECESWHLNRLFALIRVCNIKTQDPKKLSKAEIAERNRRLNEQRKAKFNTKG